ALDMEEKFLVVTNDHRAVGGGDFPHLDGSTVVYESTTTNQDVIIEYLREFGMPEIDYNWSIKPFESKGDLIIQSSLAGKNHINEADIENIEYLETDEDGWGIYKFKFQPGTDPISSFDDIENHWAKSNIEAMAAANVLEGYPNGKF